MKQFRNPARVENVDSPDYRCPLPWLYVIARPPPRIAVLGVAVVLAAVTTAPVSILLAERANHWEHVGGRYYVLGLRVG